MTTLPPSSSPFERPRCRRCGHTATVVHETTDIWAVWCACVLVSAADPHHRSVAWAETAELAIAAWQRSARPVRSAGR